MNNKFICVFDDESRAKMLVNGFTEVASDDKNHRYIFVFEQLRFDAIKDLTYTLTDTLFF